MLLEFIFRNSYSYQNETYFSMEAVKKTQIKNEFPKFNKHRILKSAVTFGPNASGKSNLLKSLKTFQDLVMRDDK
ncbi:abortive infection protein [Ligilactobacillus equi]|uniref:Abortive phage resistance protein n=1 Tax=Ligilactobacillus equi DPC 6820 TaxID=1392007 RepID=V7HYN3_9LACO|nr:abortive infection protein [Ligilactobacillus equi]ETA74333.1 abortive phage resistance protein [Ligilactobacillus equi DPC 6820]